MNEVIEKFLNEHKISYIYKELNYIPSYNIAIDQLLKFLEFLKTHPNLRFTILTDVFAADFPSRTQRFEIVYNLLSLEFNQRIIIKLNCSLEQQVPSIVNLFFASCWYEREVYDMFGIIFAGNHDLRRILTDYGFVGHPLRKDFPVTGHMQVRYDQTLEKVIYEPVSLDQAFRNFDFTSPWQGPEGILPGDEKATK